MNIYIISQWYYPEPDGRVSALAEGLVKLGHDVTVVTGFPNYPIGRIYAGYNIKWRQWEKLNGVNVLRLPLYPNHSKSVIKRVLNYASFSLSCLLIAPWFIKKPDVIWAYTPFIVMPVIYLHKIFKIPYVLEIPDMWPDTIYATGMLRRGVLTKLLNGIANIGYKYASAITVQNIGFKTCLIERNVEYSKIFVIENWADEKIFRPINYDIELAKKYKLQDKFIIMFAGNMGIAQGLNNIIEAANLCKNITEIQYVFIGDGVCLQEIKQKTLDLDIDNISFIDKKPINEIVYYLSLADVLLVSLRDDPLFEITLPGKTQAYLACGKPIIIAKRGEDAKALEKQGCAINCEPDDPVALVDAIKKIFNMLPANRIKMGVSGLKLSNEKYNKDILLKKMEEVLSRVV